MLPAMLGRLRARHPGLRLESHLSNRTQDLLRQEADIAVRMVRPTQGALLVKRVGTVKLGLFATSSYLEHHGAPRSRNDLARFAVIGPDRDASDLRALANIPGAPRAEELVYRSDNHLAQIAAIRAGIGIGICQVALAARSPALVRVLEADFEDALETWVVMHEDLRRVRRVRATFDHLVAELTAYCASA